MKFRNLSFKTQIFLFSLIMITVPIILIGVFNANRNASAFIAEYNTSRETLLTQASSTIDTLLSDATKISYLPLFNRDLKLALNTNYNIDYLSYSQDSTRFKEQFNQSNRINSDLWSCIFLNKFGYSFEYNIISNRQRDHIMENIEHWTSIARKSPNYVYFGPLQETSVVSQQNVMPMIRILRDGDTYREIGVCYTEINFKSVEKVIDSAVNEGSTILIYNAEGDLSYCSDKSLTYLTLKNQSLSQSLNEFNQKITSESTIETTKIKQGRAEYRANGCYNKTTGWHLIQLIDNSLISNMYTANFMSYSGIFIFSLVLGIALAYFLSYKLTASISRLCKEIDSSDTNNYKEISTKSCASNQELQKLVTSFNNQNHRLAESLRQNYDIRLHEQQSLIQMLQFQINHHFLYNTLNVIKSLANIHNIPEIETISVCMSDLIRYNLSKFPNALLEEEIAQVKRYMTIQEIRFPNKFSFDCTIPEQFLSLEIPVFILQPFVENCIEHGFRKKENNCFICISCNLENQILHLLVADNGEGMSPEDVEKITEYISGDNIEDKNRHSIGIRNVHQRIQNHYGKAFGVSIESVLSEGTLIDIKLPFNSKQ